MEPFQPKAKKDLNIQKLKDREGIIKQLQKELTNLRKEKEHENETA